MSTKLFALFGILIFLIACSKDEIMDTPADYTPPDSSFGLIYTNIFQSSCALSGCHVTGSRSPILDGAATYSNIVNAPVANNEAANAGLSLVLPNVPDSSFLYQKLIFADSDFKFGAPMPLGGITLTDNEIEFVRQWIAAGAPEMGHVADRTLLE